MNSLDTFQSPVRPTARQPLLGLTILLVEDSRFACEAVRLMTTRSGARVRRADSLQTAAKHLSVYRPSVALIDVGLPDGSGLALIESLSQAITRLDVILGLSGDIGMEHAVLAAGADGFLAKPIDSLAVFQTAILSQLPSDRQPPSPRLISNDDITPDRLAYVDDLSHVCNVLAQADAESDLDYVTQFLSGLSISANDTDLHSDVIYLQTLRETGHALDDGIARLSAAIEKRIAASAIL